jgi:hypothetical protein
MGRLSNHDSAPDGHHPADYGWSRTAQRPVSAKWQACGRLHCAMPPARGHQADVSNSRIHRCSVAKHTKPSAGS